MRAFLTIGLRLVAMAAILRGGTASAATGIQPPFVPGVLQTALEFYDTTDYADFGNPTDQHLDLGADATIETWVRFDSLPSGSFASFVSKDIGPDDQNKYIFGYASGYGGIGNALMFHINSPSSGPIFLHSNSWIPSIGVWNHVAVVKVGDSYTFYLNGVADGTAATSASVPVVAADFIMGRAERGFELAGALDDTRMWNIGRAAQDIQSDMNVELTGTEAGLVGYWKFDEGGGLTLNDSSTYATTGTYIGDVPASSSIGIALSPVGNPGNGPDPLTGSMYGEVDYTYAIGTYDVTVDQYAAFLNAVAETDPYGLYDPSLEEDPNIEGITQSGTPGSYSYSAIGTSGSDPVAYVTWFQAARFCNWLENGQPTTGVEDATTTEAGSYTLNGDMTSGTETAIAGAVWRLPTENEWYKAAYYDPTLGGTGGYWLYATRSNDAPGNIVGSGSNEANYEYYDGSEYLFCVTQNGSYDSSQFYLTAVGSFTNSASYYGTYDQNGDVYQWNDALIDGTSRGLRGGSWNDEEYANTLQSSHPDSGYNPSEPAVYNGFRVVSSTVPQTYTVTTGSEVNGSISPSTTQTVISGNSVVFTATPATGYGAYEWLVNGSVVQAGGATYTLTDLSANSTVQVIFALPAPNTYVLTSGTYAYNADWTAAVQGEFGPTATVADWNTIKAQYGGSSTSLQAFMQSIGFTTLDQYASLTYGGSQYADPSRSYFMEVFYGSVPGTWLAYDNMQSSTIALGSWYQDRQILAYVAGAPVTYTVTPISGSNGAISPGTPQIVVGGSNILFTASPDAGYGVDQWLVNGSTVQTGGTSYTLVDVSVSDTVEVTFEQPPAITSTLAASGSAGQFFSYHVTATNQPWSYGATGSLDGLAVDPATGIISGIPASSGTFPVGLSASNAAGTGTAGLTLTVAEQAPEITGGWYATGIVGQAFSDQIVASNSPTVYAASGLLPPGLSLDPSAGMLSGTPTVSGSFQVPVSAGNGSGTGSAVLNVLITDSNGFHEIDLSPYGNFAIQDAITTVPAPPVGNVTLGGVPFLISPIASQGNNIWSAATAEPGIGEATLTVPVNLANVSEVHLLMNTFWGRPTVLAHINLVFDTGTYVRNLLGNSDIRDYQNWVFTNLVNGVTSVPVFSGSSTYDHVAGRIDKMVIAVPAQYQGAHLLEVQAVDDGAVDVQRLLVMGLTVRVGSASLPLSVKSTPSSAGTVTTSSASAALSRRRALSPDLATAHRETPVGAVNNGQTVTVEAQAKRGWHFVYWLISGTAVSTSPDYQFIPEAGESLTAKFEPGTGHPLGVSASTGGSVARVPDAGSYLKKTKVLLTATADPGYQFAGWSGSVSSSKNPLKVKVTGDMAVTANFVLSACVIQTAANPVAGGTASGGGTVQGGTGVTVTAAAAQGYYFTNWTENGRVVSTGTSYYFEAGRSRSLVANFAQGQGVAINVPDTTGGQVTFSPAQAAYAPGTQIALSANAAMGYKFQSWNGDIQSTANPLAVTTGTTDMDIAPQFVPAAARPVLLAGTSAQTLIDDSFSGETAPGHTIAVSLKPGHGQSLYVYLQNAGASPADFKVALSGFSKPWTIKIDRVTVSKFGTPSFWLGPGEGRLFTVTLSASESLRKGSTAQGSIRAFLSGDTSVSDTDYFNLSWK